MYLSLLYRKLIVITTDDSENTMDAWTMRRDQDHTLAAQAPTRCGGCGNREAAEDLMPSNGARVCPTCYENRRVAQAG